MTRIEGVPAGSHTVEVWHEELGHRTKDVTVRAGDTAQVVVEFPTTRGRDEPARRPSRSREVVADVATWDRRLAREERR